MAQLLEDEDLLAEEPTPTRSSEMRLEVIGGFDAGSIQDSPVRPGSGLASRMPGSSRVWPLALASPPPPPHVVAARGAKEQGGARDEDPRSKDEKMALGDDESLATFGWDVEKGGLPAHRDLNIRRRMQEQNSSLA